MTVDIVRRPRMKLIINGATVSDCITAEVTMRRGAQASTFHVDASFSSLTRTLGAGWVDADVLSVTLSFGFLPDGSTLDSVDWTDMLIGEVDRVSLDQIRGVVSLAGRDHAAWLIDYPIQDAYLNKTSAEVVALLAERCGLSSNVDSTQGLVGQYYQLEHAKTSARAFSRHGNAWDLLAELADIEEYDVWVSGTTLNFKQPVTTTDSLFDVVYTSSTVQQSSPSLSIADLSMDRTTGLSGSLQVQVSSWNSRQKRQITASYPSDVEQDAKSFVVLRPNLLPDEAETLAKGTYSRLKAHQRTIRGVLPGELTLTPRHKIRLSGTQTGWDGIYTIDEIVRHMSMDQGFSEHFLGRYDPTEEAES